MLTESRAVIGYPSGNDGAILPVRYTGFVLQEKFGVLSHIVLLNLANIYKQFYLLLLLKDRYLVRE